MINQHKTYCYRITHINNLPLVLKNGIVNKHHPDASSNYIDIGNPEIIDVRSTMPVKINNYGMIGDYVPFYFTPKSMMLFNIITGYRHPLVLKRNRTEILIIRCLINDLATLPQWFFTDGQGNKSLTKHYCDLTELNSIDWKCIQESNFKNDEDDPDRSRKYQAEFLVHKQVPLTSIESLNVYNKYSANIVKNLLKQNNINMAVNIQPQYFF
ncbi:type II toxin-antitoxin system toxin DNA ADP-ribosyl transferase DarT [Chryseobacterium gossypii]|uniref:type II toxin-antitoxin system toxin DNA ADP-ribosyl transferase DarT n=1 Tax=Chryseobacterium gossypii TaxID=3231602 RepID=UPI0035252353